MTGGQIKNIIKKRYRKLRKQVKKVKKLFDDEAIHQLRVEYKKLSAFLRLISHESDASIRDLQVQQLRILEITKHEQKPLGIYSSVAAFKATKMVDSLQAIVTYVKNGKGSIGEILMDSSITQNIQEAIFRIRDASAGADSITGELNTLVAGIKNDINNGSGSINALLKDSTIVQKMNGSLSSIQKGTDGFNRNMEALKHNFLLPGYFRKLERQKEKEMKHRTTRENN